MPADVDTWVMDPDNTLYPPSTGLADQRNTRVVDPENYVPFEHSIDCSVLQPHPPPAELGMGTVLVGGSPGSGGTTYEVLGHRRWRVWNLEAFLHSLTAPAVSPWTM